MKLVKNFMYANKWLLELISLYVAVIFTPVIVVIVFEKYNQGSIANLFHVVVLIFVSSLIFYHLISYIFRSFLSPKYPKYMDYVYLSVAGLGLLGSAEITREAISSTYKSHLERAQSSFSYMMNTVFDKVSRCHALPEHEIDTECSRLMKARNTIIDNYSRTSSNPTIQEIAIILRRIANDVKDMKLDNTYPPGWFDVLAGNAEESAKFVGPPNSYYFPDISKEIGFLFLASALALRITKVTVEIRSWHRK